MSVASGVVRARHCSAGNRASVRGKRTCRVETKARAYLLDLIDLQEREKGKRGETENAVKIAVTVQKGSVTTRSANEHCAAGETKIADEIRRENVLSPTSSLIL